jgi:hypothetical protein
LLQTLRVVVSHLSVLRRGLLLCGEQIAVWVTGLLINEVLNGDK